MRAPFHTAKYGLDELDQPTELAAAIKDSTSNIKLPMRGWSILSKWACLLDSGRDAAGPISRHSTSNAPSQPQMSMRRPHSTTPLPSERGAAW